MEPDPLREIRDIRRQISKECGDDSTKVFAYYVAHQEKMKSTGKFKFATQPIGSCNRSAGHRTKR